MKAEGGESGCVHVLVAYCRFSKRLIKNDNYVSLLLHIYCSFFSIATQAILRECQVVMDYFWWPSVKRMYQTQTFKGTQVSELTLPDVLNNIIAPTSFQSNMCVLYITEYITIHCMLYHCMEFLTALVCILT